MADVCVSQEEAFRHEMIGNLDVERDCDTIAIRAAKRICAEFREWAHILDDQLDQEGRSKLKGAETGSADEKYAYAQYLKHDSGVDGYDVDEEAYNRCALYWYSEAGIQGCLRAFREIGAAFHWTCDDYGEEYLSDSEDAQIPADENISLACYFVAAKSNDAYSGYHVFLHFVHDDYAKAVEWVGRFSALPYKDRAANESWDQYQDRLCIMNCQGELDFVLGKGGPLDLSQWKPWERPYAFGICHEHGWRVEKNLDKALEYYRESAKHGCSAAVDAVKRLESAKVLPHEDDR